MSKYRQILIPLILVLGTGFPFLMAWLQPVKALAWLDWTTVVLFGIIAMAIAVHASNSMALRRRWSGYDPARGIKIHLDSMPLEIWRNGRIVDLKITPDRLLSINDRHQNINRKVSAGQGISVKLEAGSFWVVREKKGFEIVWPEGQIWEVR